MKQHLMTVEDARTLALTREGAAYIVRACNNHNALVTALEEAYDIFGEIWVDSGVGRHFVPEQQEQWRRSIACAENMRTVLAAVKEERSKVAQSCLNEDTLRRLAEALKKYGRHTYAGDGAFCSTLVGKSCDCGLDTALAAAEEA